MPRPSCHRLLLESSRLALNLVSAYHLLRALPSDIASQPRTLPQSRCVSIVIESALSLNS